MRGLTNREQCRIMHSGTGILLCVKELLDTLLAQTALSYKASVCTDVCAQFYQQTVNHLSTPQLTSGQLRTLKTSWYTEEETCIAQTLKTNASLASITIAHITMHCHASPR